MIIIKSALLSHCFINVILVLFLLASSPSYTTKASTLVYEGFDLVEVNRDSSTLLTGYQAGTNSAGNGCSWNTYYESCNGYGGTVVFYSKDRGTSYSINGNTVTYCSRYKRISFCTNSGLSTSSTTYGGVKITYNLVAKAGKVASISLSNDRSDACSGVCTDTNGKLSFPIDSKSSCDSYTGGWAAVNDNYYDTCAPPKETCSELIISKGCEDSKTNIVGTYYPTSECSGSDDADQTRSIYYSSDADKYLFYRSHIDDWVFSPSCSDFFIRAYLDAGDEPYLNAGSQVTCYDGGYTSNKKYTYTDFTIQCKKVISSGGNNNNNYDDDNVGGGGGNTSSFRSSGNGGMIAGVIIGLLVIINIVAFIVIKKRRNGGCRGTMMTSFKRKKKEEGVHEAGAGVETTPSPAQPVFPVTPPVQESSGLEVVRLPLAPPAQTVDVVQVEEGGVAPVVGTTDIYARFQELENIKPFITKKEYMMKKKAILGDL